MVALYACFGGTAVSLPEAQANTIPTRLVPRVYTLYADSNAKAPSSLYMINWDF